MVLHRDNGNGDDNIYLHSEPEEEEEEEDADEAVEEMAKPRPKKRSPTDIAKVNWLLAFLFFLIFLFWRIEFTTRWKSMDLPFLWSIAAN